VGEKLGLLSWEFTNDIQIADRNMLLISRSTMRC